MIYMKIVHLIKYFNINILHHLLINEPGPEPCHGPLIRILRQYGVIPFPCLFDVLEDDKRLLDYWLPTMEENGDLLMDGIIPEEQRALVGEILRYVVIGDSLQPQSKLHSVTEGASPHPKQLQFLTHFACFSGSTLVDFYRLHFLLTKDLDGVAS